MPEKLIPISKKQHDQIAKLKQAEDATLAQARSAARDLSVYVQAELDRLDEEIPPSTILGARCTDGVYSLALDVPEVPKAEEPQARSDAP